MANLEEFRIPQYEGCGIYAIVKCIIENQRIDN